MGFRSDRQAPLASAGVTDGYLLLIPGAGRDQLEKVP